MANQAGRPIAPARKLVAAVMGTIAVFVMAVGLGMTSWAVVIFGVAVLAMSIALGMVNMVRRGARAWVAGSAEVKAISPPPPGSAPVYGRAEIQAVVVAPGLPTSEVTIRDPRVPVAKWPRTGDTLPITVDVDDMRRVRINWDEASPQAKGEDPPPAETPYGDDPDELDNDLLGEVPPPPWTTRPDDWDRTDDDAYDETAYPDGPVVVRDTPEGRIVEGELVDPDDALPPLPRRAAASPQAAATPETEPEQPLDDAEDAPAAESPIASPGSGGAGAAFASGAATRAPSRPAGSRPSPHPRGGSTATATVEPETAKDDSSRTPHHAPTATRSPQAHASAAHPPAQRTPHPDDAFPTDIPLDEPATAAAATAAAASVVQEAQPEDQPWRPRATRPPATPSPVSSFPTAPPPTGPPPTAPPPRTQPPTTPRPMAAPTATPRPAAPSPMSSPPTAPEPVTPRPTAPAAYDDIDVPLDADPDVPPEATPEAAQALADDLIAPPAGPAPPPVATAAPRAEPTKAKQPPAPAAAKPATVELVQPSHSTTFTTNAAHESTVTTASIPVQPSAPVTARAEVPTAANAPAPASAGPIPAAPGPAAPTAAAPPPLDQVQAHGARHGAGVVAGATAAVAAAVAAVKKLGKPDKDDETDPSAGHEPAAPPAKASRPSPAPTRRDRGPWADLAGDPEPRDHTDDVITAYPSARPGPAGAINGVGITVLVTDLDRSIAFYRDILGFFEIDRGDGSAVLASGDTRLVLRTVAGLSSEAGRLIYVNLEVGDVEAVYEELQAKGVRFVHPPQPVNRGDRLELWSATFRDPDDHNIAITQWRAIH